MRGIPLDPANQGGGTDEDFNPAHESKEGGPDFADPMEESPLWLHARRAATMSRSSTCPAEKQRCLHGGSRSQGFEGLQRHMLLAWSLFLLLTV